MLVNENNCCCYYHRRRCCFFPVAVAVAVAIDADTAVQNHILEEGFYCDAEENTN